MLLPQWYFLTSSLSNSSIGCYSAQIQFTPLMEASRIGNVEIANFLLDSGADPNITNNVSSVQNTVL